MNTGGAKILPAVFTQNSVSRAILFFNELHIYESVNCPLFIEFIYIHYFDELLFLL